MAEEADVVKFRQVETRGRYNIRRAPLTACKHEPHHVVIDEESRSAICENCHKTIDTFDALWRCALHANRLTDKLNEMRKQASA